MNILEIPVEELQFRNRPKYTIIACYPAERGALVVYKDGKDHFSMHVPRNGLRWAATLSACDIIRKPKKRWRVLPLAEIVRKGSTDICSYILCPPEGERNCFTIYDADGMHHHCGELLPEGFTPGDSHTFPGSITYKWQEWMLEEVEAVE